MSYRKDRKILIVRLIIGNYLAKGRTSFERYVRTSVRSGDLSEQEAADVLKHFEREVYPVENDMLLWMLANLRKDDIKFYTKLKQLRKMLPIVAK
jgi:hypothetical protein